MGVVYLALDTSLNRRIAFKMIRPWGGSSDPLDETPSDTPEETRARFLQEAWVTGGLEHPGIVPVYELGLTPSGTPYYTMRLVRGKRTLEDAITEAEAPEQRVALLEPFLKVCDAVAFAHARGVVHRDLKPANVAMGEYGEVVVLDWGLAKVKERPDLGDARWHERMRELKGDAKTLTTAVGTPGYMPPEALLGGDLDERSDVYSLGAILYRILAGRLPHRFASYDEWARRLLGEDPPAPADAPSGLQAICTKALSREKEDRFAEVAQLAAAVRSWQAESALEREVASLLQEAEGASGAAGKLEGGALLAQLDRVVAVCDRIERIRPGHGKAAALLASARDRRGAAIAQREAAARRRVVKRAAIMGLALATAATIVVAVLLEAKRREAETARANEATERARAESERTRAEELANFMLFDLRDGLRPLGRLDLLAKVALRARDYYESLPGRDLAPMTMRSRSVAIVNVGDVLREQGALEEALGSYRRGLAITRGLAARFSAEVETERDCAVLLERIADVLEEQGDLEGAMGPAQEALAIARGLARRDPSAAGPARIVAKSLDRVGSVLRKRGDLEGALESSEESLEIRRTVAAREPAVPGAARDLVVGLTRHGDLQRAHGDIAGSLTTFGESLAIARRLLAEEPDDAIRRRDVSVALERIADVQRERGDFPGALASYRECLDNARRLVAQDPTNAGWRRDVSISLDRVGRLLEESGDVEGALDRFRESLEIARQLEALDPSNAERSREVALSLCAVAGALETQGEFDAALGCAREGLDLARALAARDASSAQSRGDLALCLETVGGILRARGDCSGALACLRESLEDNRAVADLVPGDAEAQRKLCVSLNRIGEVTMELAEFESSLAHLREGIDIARRLVAQDATHALRVRDLALGYLRLSHAQGRRGELIESLEEATAALQTHEQAARLAPHLAREQITWVRAQSAAAVLAGLQEPRDLVDAGALMGFALRARQIHEGWVVRALESGDAAALGALPARVTVQGVESAVNLADVLGCGSR